MCLSKICLKNDIKDPTRFKWFFWILSFSLLAIVSFYFLKDYIFYSEAIDGFGNIFRLLWVLPFSFMGFSFLALIVAKSGLSHDKPWLSYVFNYFPRLIAISLIIFSVLHLFEATSGYLYYFLSAGLGLYIGYGVDWIRLEEFLKR
jgi:hypothetical protein